MSYYSSEGNFPLTVGAGLTIIVAVLALNFFGWLSGCGKKTQPVTTKAVTTVFTNVETRAVISNSNGRVPVATNVTEKSSGYHVVTKISSIKFK